MPVAEWHELHFPFTPENDFAGLGVAGQDVPRLEDRRAAQRVVDTLPQEIGEIGDCGVRQRRRSRFAMGAPSSGKVPFRCRNDRAV